LFPPYGPGDHERRLIPYVVGSILKNTPLNLTTGKQEWDFVYVDDIVSAYLAVLKSHPFNDDHAIFNIGTGEAVSVRSVVEKIREKLGSDMDLNWGSIEHRMNEVWFNSANIKKAQTVLHWEPETGIDEGINKTIAWFRDYFQKDR
jgi:nucleoside-diphosphate-sugar epimerase